MRVGLHVLGGCGVRCAERRVCAALGLLLRGARAGSVAALSAVDQQSSAGLVR
jgi:hypothetical protein